MEEQKFKKINIRELLRYSQDKQVRPLHIILANHAMKKLGEIDNVFDITYHPKLASSDELSFTVYKEANGRQCRLWNDITQFRLIWVKEYKEWFQITFEIDDSTKIPKKIISAIPLCEAELSQINMDEMEVNTEADIARKDYENPTVFYNPDAVNCSLLHRVLKKIPHYSIRHVDNTLCNLQRSFSVDGNTSIYDWLTGTLAKEIGCLFLFDSNERGIYVYDIETMCMGTVENKPCNYRSINEFDVCPKCGCTTVSKPYGFDTAIFVDKNNLGNDIKLQIDTDQIKNCFYVTGGDDVINTAIKTINPNGTNEFWHFNEDMLTDMPDELVTKLNSYNASLEYYNNTEIFSIDQDIVNDYNSIINKINSIYTTNKKDEMNMMYQGFSNLISTWYDTVDLILYLQDSMMPTWVDFDKTAQTQLMLLESNLEVVSVTDIRNISLTTADSAVTLMARAIIDTSMYKFEIMSSSLTSQIWKGTVKLTSYSNKEDTATSGELIVQIDGNHKNLINQKIEKATAKIDTLGIKDLFNIDSIDDFNTELKKYCLASLESFYNAYQTAIDVLTEQGVSNESDEFYEDIYVPYHNRKKSIEAEMEVRKSDIAHIEKAEQFIEDIIKDIHEDKLDFRKCLGDYWNLFLSYKREDKFSNENYISIGLSNKEIAEKAKELIETAKNELLQSCEKQYSITATLNNLLLIKDENGCCVFEPLLDDFTLGNFIRCKIDGKIYKMRISDITIDYNDLSKLSITFYDVVSANSMMSKPKNLLDTIQSIGSSYSYTAKQAKQGEKANLTFNELQQNGLNSAQYNIFNTNSTVVFDEHGLLARNYDDVTDDYSDEQLRINGCNLLMTDNNWKSARLAIGKQKYELNKTVYEKWGLNADFCIASTIIGGDIYSANYKTDENGNITNGTHINLTSGDFELADGRIVYESDPNKMTLKDVTIQWSTKENDGGTNPPLISDIPGLETIINQKADTYYQSEQPHDELFNTQKDEEYESYVGDLWYNQNNNKNYIYTVVFCSEDNMGEKYYDYYWEEILGVPDEVYDLIDGKKSIYRSIDDIVKNGYEENDIWILETDNTSGKTDKIINDIKYPYPKYSVKTLLIATSSRQPGQYDVSDWIEAVKYTDDTNLNEYKSGLQAAFGTSTTQIDEKSVLSPIIGGGALKISNDEFSVEIDPNNKFSEKNYTNSSGKPILSKENYIFNIYRVLDDKIIMGVDTDGNGYFDGKIIAETGDIGGFEIDANGLFNITDNVGCGMQKFGQGSAFWAGAHGVHNGGTDLCTEFKIRHDGTGSIAGFDFDAYGFSTTRSVPDEHGNFTYAGDDEVLSESCCGMQGYGYVDYDGYDDWLPAFWAGNNGYGHGGTGAVFRVSHHGDLWIGSTLKERDILDVNNSRAGEVPFRVTRDGNCYLGSGQITSSDKNYKNSITSLNLQESSDFIYNLNPVSFKYNNNTSDRLHHGLIAQEVKTAMGDNDWGVYIQEENGHCGLRYEELIADLIATVQSQNKRIKDLEKRIQALESK